MRMKLFVIAITLSLLFSGILVAVEGGMSDRENVVIEEKELEKNVETKEENEPFFNITNLDYPEEVEQGDVVNIEYNVTNEGNATGTQDIVLIVYEEEVNRDENVTLEPGEEWNNTVSYDTENIEVEDVEGAQTKISNKVTILLESDDDTYRVKMTVTTEVTSEDIGDLMEDVPGFTFPLMLLGVTFTVAIYKKKKREG